MQTTFVCDLKSDLNWGFEIMHCMNNSKNCKNFQTHEYLYLFNLKIEH